MQIIVGLKCKEVSEKGCLLSLLCHLFIIYYLFLNHLDSHENRTIFVMYIIKGQPILSYFKAFSQPYTPLG